MAIDFEEEEAGQPVTNLATCAQHNLKYDPKITWGCVLCRTNQKKRISGYLVVGGILGVAAIFAYLLPVINPNEEPNLSSVVSVGSTDETDSAETVAYPCRLKLSSQIEECIANVGDTGSVGRMDKEFCLDTLNEVASVCKADLIPQKYLDEPLYKVNDIPCWSSIREPIEQNQSKIEECMDGPTYSFAARVSVDGSTGAVSDVTLSLFGLDTSQRFCLYNFFNSLQFPSDTGKPFTFVSSIDSAQLVANKPKVEDNREAEFKKFLESQRNAKIEEERRAHIMKKRSEIDSQFKQEMAPKE